MKVNRKIKFVLSLLFFCAVSLHSFDANAAVEKEEKATVNTERTRNERRVVNEVWPRVRREETRTRRERRVVTEVWPRVRRPRDTGKPTQSIPLDGGLSILVLGAAAFGARKLRKKN